MGKRKDIQFKFIGGTETKKLSKFISLKNLKAYFYFHHVLKIIEHYNLDEAPSFRKLDEAIWELIDKGYIDYKVGHKCFDTLLKHSMKKNRMSYLMRLLRMTMELQKTEETNDGVLLERIIKEGAPRNIASNFLIYILGATRDSLKKKPSWLLISNSIKEQGIIGLDDQQIKIYFHRIKKLPQQFYTTVIALRDYIKDIDCDNQIDLDPTTPLVNIFSTIMDRD